MSSLPLYPYSEVSFTRRSIISAPFLCQGCSADFRPPTSDCDCGGTAAPFLTTTISGTSTTNCDYTIQPTANSCPPPTTTIPRLPISTTTTPLAQPPAPTVGTLVCNPTSETSGCKTSDVHADSVDATADYMGEQLSTSTFTPSTGNFTRTYREGGAGGSGVTYMMSIGWIPGCTTYASQQADRPIDPAVQFDWEGLLKDTYYNCKSPYAEPYTLCVLILHPPFCRHGKRGSWRLCRCRLLAIRLLSQQG